MINKIVSRFLKEYKQVIIVRSDLKLPKGKLAVQVAHASVDCVLLSNRRKIYRWRNQGMKKIVLKVKDLKELRKYHSIFMEKGFVTSLISDAGYTKVLPGTITCLGIGPDLTKKIDEISRNLKMI